MAVHLSRAGRRQRQRARDPVGAPLHFSLTSASVMNAFFVPQLGSMIYTMNGMMTQLYLQADQPGDLSTAVGAIQRRRLLRHALHVHAVSAGRFPAWVATARRPGRRSTQPAIARCRSQSQNVPPFTYRAVDPTCSTTSSRRNSPPGPGPQAAAAGRQSPATGARLTCSASSPGTAIPSTSRSR